MICRRSFCGLWFVTATDSLELLFAIVTLIGSTENVAADACAQVNATSAIPSTAATLEIQCRNVNPVFERVRADAEQWPYRLLHTAAD